MAELESQCARLALENTSLGHQLAEEVALREQLEEQVGVGVGRVFARPCESLLFCTGDAHALLLLT